MAAAEAHPLSPTTKEHGLAEKIHLQVGWLGSLCRRPAHRRTSTEMQFCATRVLRNLTLPSHQQSSGLSSTLSDLKVALQDLNAELREERQSSQELTQQFARAKASWEVERTELKSLITQVSSHSTDLVHLLKLRQHKMGRM